MSTEHRAAEPVGATGLVSVIIPTFRRAKEVRMAAESALAQTWTNLEVLVVSDGPDPATREAMQGLDSRLRYLELPRNVGPAEARNAGMAGSKGEWLMFLDDDDLMLPRKVEVEMRLADAQQPWRMVSCRTLYRRGTREDAWPDRPIAAGEDLADYILLRPSLLGRPGVIPIQTLLVHRSIVEQVPFATHADHEDWAWLLEAWHLAGARVVFAWEVLVVYNIDTESLSRSRRMNWEDSLRWAESYRAPYRAWIGDRAFSSFLCTKAALKAKRAGDWKGLRSIARKAMSCRPGALEWMFLAGTALLPGALLAAMWKRSLRSEGGSETDRLLVSKASQQTSASA